MQNLIRFLIAPCVLEILHGLAGGRPVAEAAPPDPTEAQVCDAIDLLVRTGLAVHVPSTGDDGLVAITHKGKHVLHVLTDV